MANISVLDIVIFIFASIIGGAYFMYIFNRINQKQFSGKPDLETTGEIERIGPFQAGNMKGVSYVFTLKGHSVLFYAHPNFGRSLYKSSDFQEQKQQLALTQVGDQVQIKYVSLKGKSGSENIVMDFSNLSYKK